MSNGVVTLGCCCSLCCVRASLQSTCRVLWSCVLHSTSSVIVSRVLWKLCYTPQALSLYLESWDSVLCLLLCLCPFLFVYCPPVYILLEVRCISVIDSDSSGLSADVSPKCLRWGKNPPFPGLFSLLLHIM